MTEVPGCDLEQPATHACGVIYPDVHDIPGLAALLHGHVPGNPAVVDLQGRVLSGAVDALRIRTPGLILKHGTLCLPPQVPVIVIADGIKLHDITITRTHAAQERAIGIRAKGVGLELCRMPGVYVARDSSAVLRWCIMSGSPGDGVCVAGPGSHVEVQDCDSHSNYHAGFAALGVGAVMRFIGRCKAATNRQGGFAAVAGAKVTCSDGCVAQGNRVGFLAAGLGSQLIAGHGCRAVNNTDTGFQASDGAKVAVGGGSEACNNGRAGFLSFQPGSQLCLGKGCKTVRNGGDGASASKGGKVVAGQGCVATSNNGAGFSSGGNDAMLRVGGGSRAAYNMVNFGSVNGGVLEAGEGCRSSKSGGRSIMVSGKLGPDPPEKRSMR